MVKDSAMVNLTNESALKWLKAVIDASPLAIIALDTDAKVILWSPAAERIFGWEADEVLGKFHPAVTERTQQMFYTHFHNVLYGDKYPGTLKLSHMTKSGELIYISASVSRLTDQDGNIIGAMGVLEDITQIVLDQNDLMESKQRYRCLLEAINDGFVVFDTDLTIIFANQSFAKMLQLDEETITGTKVTDYMDNPNSFNDADLAPTKSYELTWIRKNGTKVYTIISSSNKVCTANEGVLRSAVITDISKMKASQIALKKKELELKTSKRNLEEMNTALKILLRKRDDDKKNLEENMISNVNNTIMPLVAKLKKHIDDQNKVFIEILEVSLNDIISPFSKNLSFRHLNFTPTELQVATFIKQGMQTKEIADIMNLSVKTVEDHRKHMRKKLGISCEKANLRSRLLYISEE